MSDPDPLVFAPPRGTSQRPLFGMKLLLVEDSRFAAEAVRLMCLKSGARLRRADSLAAAHRHLNSYRPDVVIVDMGLPDGSGADLITELAVMDAEVPVILGLSGDPGGERPALDAGAQGFLHKPLGALAAFQSAILNALPSSMQPRGPRILPDDLLVPDPLALKDDLAHAAELLHDPLDTTRIAYLSQFLSGIAKSADDSALGDAAKSLDAPDASARQSVIDQLQILIASRTSNVIAMV